MTQSLAHAPSWFKSAEKLPAQDRGRLFDFTAKFLADSKGTGLNLEAVRGAASPNIFSARVTQDYRAILARHGGSHVLLYVGHHDDAYSWARRHRFDQHSVTGELQIVAVAEVEAPVLTSRVKRAKLRGRFDGHANDYLLSLGVPEDWLATLRKVTTDDELMEVLERLPHEVGDRLFQLAAGKLVTPPTPVPRNAPLDAHPDHRSRFYVVRDASELQELLAKPLQAWLKYLHPSQRALADGTFKGAVKVTGSAGTGKTVVAMHRAARLAHEGRRVLLTSYVTTLCDNISANLDLLCDGDVRQRITAQTVDKTARDLLDAANDGLQPVSRQNCEERIRSAARLSGTPLDQAFLESEFSRVVAPQALQSWDEYRSAPRTGRGRPLSARDRKAAWAVFGRVLDDLAAEGRAPWPFLCRRAREHLEAGRSASTWDAVIVDELQDLNPQQVRLVAALVADPAALMVVGDAGQRIFAGGFSLHRLGVNVRGRSHVLRINYRTTEQIRRAADRVLGAAADDMDEGEEARDARSLLLGPDPHLRGFADAAAERGFLIDRLRALRREGLAWSEIGAFAPTNEEVRALTEELRAADVPVHVLGPGDREEKDDAVRLGTMHRAKGLEFKNVFAVDCSTGSIPSRTARSIQDAVDRALAEAQARSLLYVVMTRARDELTITWRGKPSPFLQPFLDGTPAGAVS